MKYRVSTAFVGLLLNGCMSQPSEVDSVGAEIAIPGPWVAPEDVRAIAATQFVDVVDPPPVSPAGSCASSNPFACSCTHPACTPAHPGTNELREYLLDRFPGIRNSGTYCCRQNSGRTSHLSVHAIGRAIDLGVTTIGGDADNTIGDEVANFLVANAEYIGIQRVIWDHTFWNGERGFGALGGNPHVDHLHIELSIAGANRETPFFTLGAPMETCTPQCVGTRLVNADCSSVECAATGAECLAGPPRCGEPPPPEPPASVRTGGALPAIATVGEPGRLTFTGPDRMFDTRASMEGLTWDEASNELTWASSLPPAVTGVFLNVAIVPTNPGHVIAFPTGSTRPGTSNLNTSGRVRANLVPVPLGTDQSVTFFQLDSSELIADLYATTAAAGSGLELIDPTRVYDTRSIDMPLRADEVREIDVGAPADSTGVLASIVAIRPEMDAFLSAFPCGRDPETSTVNVRSDEIASNQLISGLGPEGTVCLRAIRDMHVVIDVLGYFSPEGLLEYQALTPVRLVDTRSDVYYSNRLAAHQEIEIPLAEAPGMPENGWAAVFNVATVQADGDGHLIAYACERGSAPATSAHNFGTDVRATMVTSDLGTSRRACFTSSTRSHIIIDLLGMWRRGDGAPPPEPEPIPEPTPEPIPEEDGGVGDGGFVDGGVGLDDGGCGCRTSGSPSNAVLLLLVIVWVRRRR